MEIKVDLISGGKTGPKYSDLYEHYVNSVANNRLSIIDNMLSYVV